MAYGAVLGLIAWLWISLIGGGLESRRERRREQAPSVASRPSPATTAALGAIGLTPTAGPDVAALLGGTGEGTRATTTPAPSAKPTLAGADLAAPEILPAARELVLRGVKVSYLRVGRADGARASSLDLLEAALNAAGLELSASISKDRARHPEHYGIKRSKKQRGDIVRLTPAMSPKNVTTFLANHAQRLTLAPVAGPLSTYLPGDVVFLERKGLRDGPLGGIVSDLKDHAGTPLVVTIDPKDGVATDTHPLNDYRVRSHFRLSSRRVETIRAKLEPVRSNRRADARVL